MTFQVATFPDQHITMVVKPSQKIVTSDVFKEEHLNARDAPLTFTPDSLIQHIKQQMPQDRYIVQPKHVNISAGLGPYFYKLSRELRDEIFIDLLASGHPNFMRTSRAMEQEGKAWVSKAGVYRINVAFPDRAECQMPSRDTVDRIQNVNLKVNGWMVQLLYQNLEHFNTITGPRPHRKTCNVSLKGSPSIQVTSSLQRLTAFEKVVFPIFENWTDGARIRDNFEDYYIKPHDRVVYADFERVRHDLEPHLGKADVGSDRDVWNMVFYPRKAIDEAPVVVGSGGNSGTQS